MYNCHRPTFQHWWSVTMDCFTAKVMRIQGFLIDWNQIEIRFGLGNLESVFQIQMWFFRNPIFTSQFCAARFPKVCDAASISVGLQSLWGLKESGLNCSCQNKKSAPNIDWIPTVCNNFELKNGWISFYCEHQPATKRSPEGCHWDVARQDSRHWIERVATER